MLVKSRSSIRQLFIRGKLLKKDFLRHCGVVFVDFGSWVSPLHHRGSTSERVIPAKNPIHGCQGRPERTYSMVSKGAVAIGS